MPLLRPPLELGRRVVEVTRAGEAAAIKHQAADRVVDGIGVVEGAIVGQGSARGERDGCVVIVVQHRPAVVVQRTGVVELGIATRIGQVVEVVDDAAGIVVERAAQVSEEAGARYAAQAAIVVEDAARLIGHHGNRIDESPGVVVQGAAVCAVVIGSQGARIVERAACPVIEHLVIDDEPTRLVGQCAIVDEIPTVGQRTGIVEGTPTSVVRVKPFDRLPLGLMMSMSPPLCTLTSLGVDSVPVTV